MAKNTRVSEEKLLNDMFVILEYSDSFKEFVANLTDDMIERLIEELCNAGKRD